MLTKRTGWGRNLSAKSEIHSFEDPPGFSSQSSKLNGLPIGLGRSYGDSALNSGGISWSSKKLNSITLNSETGIATCESGVTIGELERYATTRGFFPPTVPGTEVVSIGGAIASDIHGKSHFTYGSFSSQLISITLIKAKGGVEKLSPNGENAKYFWATVGGMGLTGFILSAEIKLIPITSSYVDVENRRANNLEHLMTLIKDFDKKYLYTVGWIDLSGDFRGRGIVSGGNHAPLAALPEKFKTDPLQISVPRNLSLPDIFPSFTINPLTVRAFNELWFRKPLHNGISHLRPFLHPLDSISNWNVIYGKQGLLQYQFQIPPGAEVLLFQVLDKLRELNFGSFLGVLKQFGSASPSPLSFAQAGWTLAIDFPAGLPGLEKVLQWIDERICEVGGRVYLTKDARLPKSIFQQMYPEFGKWLQLKQELDPMNYWQSDQGRRLGLC